MHQSGTSKPGTTEKTNKNDFGEMIAIDRYKTSDTTTNGRIMIGTGMIKARTITKIVMIEITRPAKIRGETINRETMMIGTGKDIGTTDAIIKNGTLEKRSVGNR